MNDYESMLNVTGLAPGDMITSVGAMTPYNVTVRSKTPYAYYGIFVTIIYGNEIQHYTDVPTEACIMRCTIFWVGTDSSTAIEYSPYSYLGKFGQYRASYDPHLKMWFSIDFTRNSWKLIKAPRR